MSVEDCWLSKCLKLCWWWWFNNNLLQKINEFTWKFVSTYFGCNTVRLKLCLNPCDVKRFQLGFRHLLASFPTLWHLIKLILITCCAWPRACAAPTRRGKSPFCLSNLLAGLLCFSPRRPAFPCRLCCCASAMSAPPSPSPGRWFKTLRRYFWLHLHVFVRH